MRSPPCHAASFPRNARSYSERSGPGSGPETPESSLRERTRRSLRLKSPPRLTSSSIDSPAASIPSSPATSESIVTLLDSDALSSPSRYSTTPAGSAARTRDSRQAPGRRPRSLSSATGSTSTVTPPPNLLRYLATSSPVPWLTIVTSWAPRPTATSAPASSGPAP